MHLPKIFDIWNFPSLWKKFTYISKIFLENFFAQIVSVKNPKKFLWLFCDEKKFPKFLWQIFSRLPYYDFFCEKFLLRCIHFYLHWFCFLKFLNIHISKNFDLWKIQKNFCDFFVTKKIFQNFCDKFFTLCIQKKSSVKKILYY